MADSWDATIAIDPDQPLEAVLKQFPARWAVYLMRDTDGRAVQLLSVKNLRASVKRRLGPQPEALSKRVDYRAVVRSIEYRRVDSPLESDLAYFAVAKDAFPKSYRNLMSLRQPWFVEVNPNAPFPRWSRTDEPDASACCFGPMLERSHAAKLVETLEDLFDLCRYYNVLTQSPHGSACAYKDMGKCPAPCDGSVSMQQYRAMIEWSIRVLRDPQTEIDQQTDRMRAAAADLKFEAAGRIKDFMNSLNMLGKGDWRFTRPLEDFRYLAVAPGPGKGQAKFFAITPEAIECVACVRGEPTAALAELDALRSLALPSGNREINPESLHRLGIVVRHLFNVRSPGVFLHGDDLSDQTLAQAWRQATRRTAAPEPLDDEGVLAELAAEA